MMGIIVDPVSGPGTIYLTNANQMVGERFDYVTELTERHLAQLTNTINQLKAVINQFEMPAHEVDIDLPNHLVNIISVLQGLRPDPPDPSQLELPDVPIDPDIDLPVFEGVRPNIS
ncbi:MAG: hypothetical protein GY869_31635, partial [Planctomycetes bacterium]|nr:hypothetical protein [Planctomycetota bacterium]